MTVGERIQDLRKKKGFSQEKLAEYLNMSRQAVAKWEQNVCEPNLDCLATGVCVWTRQNTDIYALFAKFDFARTTKYEQSRLRQKSSKIAAFWLQASIALRF